MHVQLRGEMLYIRERAIADQKTCLKFYTYLHILVKKRQEPKYFKKIVLIQLIIDIHLIMYTSIIRIPSFCRPYRARWRRPPDD